MNQIRAWYNETNVQLNEKGRWGLTAAHMVIVGHILNAASLLLWVWLF